MQKNELKHLTYAKDVTIMYNYSFNIEYKYNFNNNVIIITCRMYSENTRDGYLLYNHV